MRLRPRGDQTADLHLPGHDAHHLPGGQDQRAGCPRQLRLRRRDAVRRPGRRGGCAGVRVQGRFERGRGAGLEVSAGAEKALHRLHLQRGRGERQLLHHPGGPAGEPLQVHRPGGCPHLGRQQAHHRHYRRAQPEGLPDAQGEEGQAGGDPYSRQQDEGAGRAV